MNEARRIRSEKLREHQYRGICARSLEGKRVEWDGEYNFEHMWEQVKQVMVECVKRSCVSVRVGGGKNPKSVWWNDEVKTAVRRKDVFGAEDEEAKERFMEA